MICKKYEPQWRQVKDLFFRRFPSDNHKEKWVKYEQILMIRTMMGIASRIALSIAGLLLGHEPFMITEKLLE